MIPDSQEYILYNANKRIFPCKCAYCKTERSLEEYISVYVYICNYCFENMINGKGKNGLRNKREKKIKEPKQKKREKQRISLKKTT